MCFFYPIGVFGVGAWVSLVHDVLMHFFPVAPPKSRFPKLGFVILRPLAMTIQAMRSIVYSVFMCFLRVLGVF